MRQHSRKVFRISDRIPWDSGQSATVSAEPGRSVRQPRRLVPGLRRLVAAPLRVVLVENPDGQSGARLAEIETWTRDQSRKVSTLGMVWPHRPAEVVAERTARGVRELATLRKREERRKIHAPSLPVVLPFTAQVCP
jgi:hypothetical protein